MKRMDIPRELQISVYHEGVLLLLAYSSYGSIIDILRKSKSEMTIIKEITQLSDHELFEKYQVDVLNVTNTNAWSKFLKELQILCRKYKEYHPLVLGSIIEIMSELNWQEEFDIRKFLVFFLDTKEELAHLKLATSGTKFSFLENWRQTIIDEAKGYAAYKSKIT